MVNAVVTSLVLMLPLILSGSFHMLVVRRCWFNQLSIPIHEASFGKNKTWRGIIVMILATIPATYLTYAVVSRLGTFMVVDLFQANPLWLGAMLGLGYVIPELPNSYIKRRLNIPPGKPASSHAFWFRLMDQADSAIGCAIVYALMVEMSVPVFVWVILLAPLVHLIANVSLYSVGLRKQPF